jgi:hypothetical protein
MRLLSVNLARSIWLGSILEFNPRGKNLYAAIPLLVASYKFKTFPSQAEIPDYSKGVKFEEGEFKNSEGDLIAINLTIFTDGIVADTRSSTQDSDAFLLQVLTQLSEQFNLPHFEQIIRKKNYVSQLYVTTRMSLNLINPGFKEAVKYLSENLSVPFEIGGLSFWVDPSSTLQPFQFSFERALNVPFAEKKYYTVAPLQTEKHIELLEKFETILLMP